MVTSGRPICVKCSVEMHCEKNGAVVEHMGSDGPHALQSADKYRCPICGVEVMSGFGQTCLADSWQKDRYANTREFEDGLYPITRSWMSINDKEIYEREARPQISQG